MVSVILCRSWSVLTFNLEANEHRQNFRWLKTNWNHATAMPFCT